MKHIFRFLAAVAVMLFVACACAKEGTRRFEGNYTFKTGGTLSVRPVTDNSAELSDMAIVPESGQMDIVTTDKSSGGMIVTMNILGGTVVTFDAKADGSILTLSPIKRQVTLSPPNLSSDLLRPLADVEVCGYGERFENIIIFRLDYKGHYTYSGTEYEIVRSAVDCVAKMN
ncbi:MAG: hypothetical protein K2H95_09110 [Bacteroidales bacterium]|nr:hypothetical protein [Bacteroidales bacterium]